MRKLNYTIRILLNSKFYSLINILGLTIGLSVSIIVLLYVQDDLSYDKHHKNWEQVHRIESQFRLRGKNDDYALTPITLAEMLKDTYPEILHFTRFQTAGQQSFRWNDKQVNADNMFFADSTVFDLFSHDFLYGDPESALTKPRSIVLTASLAQKIFDEANPVNEILESDNGNYLVTGVVEDLPENLHLKFDALISMATRPIGRQSFTIEQKRQRLWNVSVYSYVMFPKDYDYNNIYSKFPDFFEEHMAERIVTANLGDSYFSPKFVPLNEIHFNSKVLFDLPSGNKTYTLSFLGIGILVLLLASINYINLATARAVTRSKEVGIKKVLGSSIQGLRFQFLLETYAITSISLIIAFFFTGILITSGTMDQVLGKRLEFNLFQNPMLFWGPVLITLIVAFFSGLYPALYLTSIKSLSALKGQLSSGPKGILLRKGLVSIQFFISISVVILTILMLNQIRFMQNKDLGFNQDSVVLIPIQDTIVRNKMRYLKADMLENPSIVGVTDAFGVGGNVRVGNSLLGAGRRVLNVGEPKDSSFTQDTYNVLTVGEDYVQTMGLEILAGRDFNESMPTDLTQKVLINQALVDQMGWKDPIDKIVTLTAANPPTRVIGVVNDFHAYSMHVPIEPMVIYRYQIRNPRAAALPTLMVNIKSNDLSESLSFLKSLLNEYDPRHPFEFEFLDNKVAQLYLKDKRQNQLIGGLSLICILTSCLGLLGLSSFSTSRRIKEIGVRKVLGANISQLVYLIFKEVLSLILIGFLLSVPLAYYLVDIWLQAFAYQLPIMNALIFAALATGVFAILIAFITVSYHSIKAASQNPVKALRYE